MDSQRRRALPTPLHHTLTSPLEIPRTWATYSPPCPPSSAPTDRNLADKPWRERTLRPLSQDSAAVLAPLRQALEEHFGSPSAVPDDLELRTDHGPQYTGDDCHASCMEWNLDHTFAPVGPPTGNSVAVRLIRTLKEGCIWPRDWKSLAELRAAIDAWMVTYDELRPHQALNWSTPAERRAEHLSQTQRMAS